MPRVDRVRGIIAFHPHMTLWDHYLSLALLVKAWLQFHDVSLLYDSITQYLSVTLHTFTYQGQNPLSNGLALTPSG